MRTKPTYITMQVGRRFLVIRVPASGKRGYLMGTAPNQITAEEIVEALDRQPRTRKVHRPRKPVGLDKVAGDGPVSLRPVAV